MTTDIQPTNPAPVTKRTKTAFPFAVPLADRERFDKLPSKVREDVQLLLLTLDKVHNSKSVKGGCMAHATNRRGFKPASLRRKYYAYVDSGGDWAVLVDEAKAPPTKQSLPEEFLEYWRKLCGSNKRKCRPAYNKMMEEWRTGHDTKGQPVTIPGYGKWQTWFKATYPHKPLPLSAPTPRGWDYTNLMRPQNRLSKVQLEAARKGTNAAREFLPHVLRTRVGLRFLEEVMFDDVKTDFRVVDPEVGQVCDLWLLTAHDRATDMRLGYGMLPARARDDGSQEHLRLSHMKQLAGWVLQRWGLPPYPIRWKVERGTATFQHAVAAAIHQLTGGHITVSFSQMIGGTAPSGYREKAIGNSRAKATLEAGNNLFHNIAADLPGQTGRRYDVRPTDLPARESETREVLELYKLLSPELRTRLQFPVLTLDQARLELNRIFEIINRRTEHELEGFDVIWEWRISDQYEWQPIDTYPPEAQPGQFETRKRKHSPHERMIQLTRGLEWHPVSNSVLVHFYQDNQRFVSVGDDGEIRFDMDGKTYVFSQPSNSPVRFLPGQKFLAYHHATELDFIHLTQPPPHNGYVATWARRQRVANGDRKALEEALRYTETAKKAELEALTARHADEAEANAQRRLHNATLAQEHLANQQALEVNMVQVAPLVGGNVSIAKGSPIAAALDAVRQTKVERKQEKIDLVAQAKAALAKSNNTEHQEEK
jgi:hypothetical protein